MALLDVSDVLSDPLFADPLTVIRNRVTVGADGVAARTTTTFDVSGVITAGKGDVVNRSPDGGRVAGSITVVTKFRLSAGSGAGRFEPDIVVFGGEQFTVTMVSDYSNFGAGFVQADCENRPVAP